MRDASIRAYESTRTREEGRWGMGKGQHDENHLPGLWDEWRRAAAEFAVQTLARHYKDIVRTVT